MKDTTFKAIVPQLKMLPNVVDDMLVYQAWDSYDNWLVRRRQVKKGTKAVTVKLPIREQVYDKETDEVLSTREYERTLVVFHHSMTDPISGRIQDEVGTWDVENRERQYFLDGMDEAVAA